MAATVRELAELVRGQVHGNGDELITDARSLGQADPGHVSFVENDTHLRRLADCRASALVVGPSLPLEGRTLIRAADPLASFLTIVQHLRNCGQSPPPGLDPRAVVHPSVTLGPDCSIQANAVIGAGTILGARCRIYPGAVIGRDCRLGDDVTIYPNAVLYDGIIVGHRVIIHANAVIGADGFGYRMQQGKHVKVPQLGTVELGDDVEVGACTTIDRGTIDPTSIGPGTKIDNLVMIAHNCRVGPHNVLAGQVGIAGSCSTGAYVCLAGQVGVADHSHISDQAIIGAQSGVTSHIPPGGRYFGTPARPEREQKRALVSLMHLPEMRQDLKRIRELLKLDSKEEAA